MQKEKMLKNFAFAFYVLTYTSIYNRYFYNNITVLVLKSTICPKKCTEMQYKVLFVLKSTFVLLRLMFKRYLIYKFKLPELLRICSTVLRIRVQ